MQESKMFKHIIWILIMLSSGCKQIQDDSETTSGTVLPLNVEPIMGGAWYQPGIQTTWQWQLKVNRPGTINTRYDVEVYDVDLFTIRSEEIARLQNDGRRVICYFSAGTYENWQVDKDKFTPADYGLTLEDWNRERWLDIRSVNVHNIMLSRLDLAVEKGCDGVEPDNVDAYAIGFERTGFTLTANDQLAFNRFLANQAHMRNLSIGLKNDLDQIRELVDYFDFAVNEQCFEYNECELLLPFIDANKAVFTAEYENIYKTDTSERNALCNRANNLQLSTLILSLSLDDSYRDSCF